MTTGLRALDSALSLLDRQVNVLGMEGSRMDWEDLVEWQQVLLGGDPPERPETPATAPSPYRVADLPDPMRSTGRVWGSSGEPE